MNTDDLLRYTKPTTELEIALYNALQEQVTQGNIEATREIERLEETVEWLEDDLESALQDVSSLTNRVADLEDSLANVLAKQ
jgi:polyhydroxyalkanoate synthesis regulator phasin